MGKTYRRLDKKAKSKLRDKRNKRNVRRIRESEEDSSSRKEGRVSVRGVDY